MEGEGEEVDGTRLIQGNEQGWTTHYHQHHHQEIGNVVHIIVPDISCMHHEQSDTLAINTVTSNGSLQVVGHHDNKDPLAALAAAAEMDQVRTDCVEHMMEEGQQVEHMMEGGVEHMGVDHMMEQVDHCQREQIHHDVEVMTNIGNEVQVEVSSMMLLPTAPFLNPDDPDSSFYNEIYHFLASNTLPPGCTEEYHKLLKKRSNNYRLNSEGTLSYSANGNKNLKTVIPVKEEQYNLLEMSHVDQVSGVHYGVKKMYSLIYSKYYWRTLYTDIGNYVRNCTKCTEHYTTDLKDTCEVERSYNSLPSDRLMRVWKKVEVAIHGPYTKTKVGNEYVISMVDPFSRWMTMQCLKLQDLTEASANFIFEAFCKFGFAQCQVVGMSSPIFERMQMTYKEKFDRTHNILKTLVPFECEEAQKSFLFTLQEDSHECRWAVDLIEDVCLNNVRHWDEEISRCVFEFCTSSGPNGEPSPFSVMFARNPTGYISEEDKENINLEKAMEVTANRRKLRSSTLECRHCHESFTSKISFRIHQRKHTEEARRRGSLGLEGSVTSEEHKRRTPLRGRRRRVLGRVDNKLCNMTSEWNVQKNVESSEQGVREQVTHRTVTAVRNLLLATKEERSRRGKYYKYPQELREEMAEYAMENSTAEAVTYFSEKLGNPVKESSIRNFIRAYRNMSKGVKEEIGKLAFLQGVDKAAETFSDKLGCEIKKGLVKKCKKNYINQINDPLNDQSTSGDKRTGTQPVRQKRTFSYQTKHEVGRYASIFGITAAIQHYSEKLQFTMKESTVRKFKKQYLERYGNSIVPGDIIDSDSTVIGEQHQNSNNQNTVDVMHQNIPVLNTSSAASVNVTANNFVYQQPYAVNVANNVNAPTVLPMNHNTLAFHQTGVINQGMAIPYQQQAPVATSVIMNQSFTHQPQTFQPSYVNGFPGHGTSHIVPLTMAHSNGVVTSLTHSTSPLSLTMGSNHHNIGLNHPASVNQNNHMTNTASLSNSSHQLVPTSFHQPLTTNLTFDETANLQSQANVAMNNEPLSLMKEAVQEQHIDDPNPIQNTVVTVTSANLQPSTSMNSTMMPHLDNTTNEQEEEMISIIKTEEYDSPPPRKKKRKDKLKVSSINKRGNYVSYSPELRAEIGKYAAEHGNLAATNHFKQKLGLDIPESTVRGLKDKYMLKRLRGEKEVTSLGFAQRGRPVRLGQYDEQVQECIRELVKSGEKISSFLVIATAKHVLMQYDPQSLEENGGPVRLNPTWAKSFLKRIGLSHLS